MGLSLEKKSEIVRLCLEKRKVPTDIKLAVRAAFDVSGSMQDEFRAGLVQELSERLMAIGMRFDDNQSLEAYAYGSDAAQVGDITLSNYATYINKVFLKDVPDRILWSGTHYGRALKLIKNDQENAKKASGGGFFGGLFGKKQEQPKRVEPAYLMFITDGDTSDEAMAESMLEEMSSSKMYIQLIGLGTGSRFTFLKRMADQFDHVGFVTFPNLSKTTDEAMYEALLCDEFCTWIKNQ